MFICHIIELYFDRRGGVISTLFLFGHYIAARRSFLSLIVFIFMYSLFFCSVVLSSPFWNFHDGIFVDYVVALIILLYNILFFTAYKFFCKYGLTGCLMFSLIFSLLSYLWVIIPLNPLLLNLEYDALQWSAKSPVFCLFMLFLIPAILFAGEVNGVRAVILLVLALILFIPFTIHGKNDNNINDKRIKVVVVQVGLYYEKGGNTERFFDDLYNFINMHKDVDIIVFSENVIYGHKSIYNKNLTDRLISKIKEHNINKQYALLLNLHGYNNINNIVTLLMYKDEESINQKQVLIPFIEKRTFVDKYEPLNSKFLNVHSEIDKKTFRYKNFWIDTYVCYDSLFPRLRTTSGGIVLVQSDYKQLDRGRGFDSILLNGSKLSWFSTALNSDLFINVQNYGGTVVIRKNKGIDKELFLLSKEQPFFVVSDL